MKIDKSSKIEQAVAKESSRYAFNAPYYDHEAHAMIATDGRILAVVPVLDDDDDVTGLIPVDAIKVARKGRLTNPIRANGTIDLLGVSYTRPEGRFPAWRDVIPKISDIETDNVKLRIDARLLYNLSQALGSDKVELTIDRNTLEYIQCRLSDSQTKRESAACGTIKPFIVKPVDGVDGAYGAMMPITRP